MLICLLMINEFGYRNVAENVYEHGPLLSIHGSSCVDRAIFDYVIVRCVFGPYEFLSSQLLLVTTWTVS